MKILISSLGSRGDIQPYLALAVGLQQAGHRVTLVAPHTFAKWIASYGVTAHPVRYNPGEAMKDPEVQAILFRPPALSRLSFYRCAGRWAAATTT